MTSPIMEREPDDGMNGTTEETTMVGRAQAGEEAAFEELVRRCSRMLYARLYSETGNAATAEDLVQETWLTAYRNLPRLRDPGGFRGWLLVLGRNACIDHVRRATRRKRKGIGKREPESSLLDVPDGEAAPSEQAERRELLERALQEIRSLPEPYGEPLTMRFLWGMDTAEIAAQLDLSEGEIRGRLHRGCAMLRGRLREKIESRDRSDAVARTSD